MINENIYLIYNKKYLLFSCLIIINIFFITNVQAGNCNFEFQDNFDNENVDEWLFTFSHDPRHLPPNPYVYGNWRIENGELTQDDGTDHQIALIKDITFSDQIFEARVKMKSQSGYAGITIWYYNENNWINIFIYPSIGEIWLYPNIEGSLYKSNVPISKYPYDVSCNKWYNLKIEGDSSLGKLTIYIDGIKLFSHEVNSKYKEGLSGLNCGNNGAYFDDIKVTHTSTLTNVKENAFTIERYDYSWFENNAELRIHATDLMIINLEPYNDTAKNYFQNLNKDIKDQVLFPIIIEFGNSLTPLPFDYDTFQLDSVEEFNEITKAMLIAEGKLSNTEIMTVASYDLKALNMLLWYKDAMQNIDATKVVDDDGQSVLYPLNSANVIYDLNYYKQLLIQERDYWIEANNAETVVDQEQAITNTINIINQEKMIMRNGIRSQHNLYKYINDNTGFYYRARQVEGKPQATANLLVGYIQKQQDYVNDFEINNIDMVASSLSNKDNTKITSKLESALKSSPNLQQNHEKTSVVTLLEDVANKIIEWIGSIF